MNIGIIGAGNMGGALGKLWADAGHTVLFSFARDTQELKARADAAGHAARTGTPAEAAAFGDVIFLGVPYPALHEAMQAAGSLEGKLVISCVSGLRPDFENKTMGLPTDLNESVAEQIARLAPTSRVVEAFNLTFAEILASDSRQFGAERPGIFYCGDDAEAKKTAAELIETCGYEAVDAGALITARSLETLASAWVQFAVVSKLFPDVALKILRR